MGSQDSLSTRGLPLYPEFKGKMVETISSFTLSLSMFLSKMGNKGKEGQKIKKVFLSIIRAVKHLNK